MPIRTIETVVNIEDDRRLIVQLPADVPLGLHRIALMLDETAENVGPAQGASAESWKFPVVEHTQWPADMPLTRVCWFSLIWKNRLVELASKRSGHAFRVWALYSLGSAELRFPLPCCAFLVAAE